MAASITLCCPGHAAISEKNGCEHSSNVGENSPVVGVMAMQGSVSRDCMLCRVGMASLGKTK